MKSWRNYWLVCGLAFVSAAHAEPEINTVDGDLAIRSEIALAKPDPNPPVTGVPVEPYVSAAPSEPPLHAYAEQTGAWALFLTGIGGVAWFAWRNLQTARGDTRWKKRHAKWLPF